MPSPYVPAKIVSLPPDRDAEAEKREGTGKKIAIARTSVAIMPLFCSLQVSPLSVDRKTPPPKYVPAKMSPLAFVANERTKIAVNPLLTCVQLSPLSVLGN